MFIAISLLYFLLNFCTLICTTTPPKPLILTPLLKSKNVAKARDLSNVEPFFPGIIGNSGFFTVNETTDSNIFFWFFRKASDDWKDAPLLLWLQGGPGCSSMFALFTENGPIAVTNGKLNRRKCSWTRDYNVLFIDNPIGSGFSFSSTGYNVTTEIEIGEHLYKAMLQFLQLYPELRENKFFITGESYAGKYIPVLGYTIDKHNPTAAVPINLKGMFIGNGWSDPENMFDLVKHLHRIGIIDYRTTMKLQKIEAEIRILIRSGLWKKADRKEGKLYKRLKNVTEFGHFYNYLYEKEEDETYIDFLEKADVRKAIHVGNVPYEDCSEPVGDNLQSDIYQSVKPLVEELLEKYPIMFYSGQTDIIVAHFLTTNFLEQLQWSGAAIFSVAPKKKWHVGTSLAGYYKEADNLKFALIRDAGHMVPTGKPEAMLDLLNKFINEDL